MAFWAYTIRGQYITYTIDGVPIKPLKYIQLYRFSSKYISMVSCQKGPARHAYAWQIGPFRQGTFNLTMNAILHPFQALIC